MTEEKVKDLSEHTSEDLNEILSIRRDKLNAIREQGTAFPNHFKPSDSAQPLIEQFNDKTKEELEELSHEVTIAGRVMLKRTMGKAAFIHIQDVSGRIQLYLRKNDLPDGVFDAFTKWDLGDIIGASGTMFKTKTGELSVKVKSVELLVKSLRPLPDKFHGLTDTELRYRQRYLDLIMSEESMERFIRRSKLIDSMRSFLKEHHFLEVETPMMQSIPGGATARPFVTHHNALDMELYMRIAPELYLKRLIVGGMDRVFEINRNFRNEGISTQHNPEFTMVEFYQAYATYEDLMNFTEKMFAYLATAVLGQTSFSYQDVAYDFSKPFERLTMRDAVLKHNPNLDAQSLSDSNQLCQYLQSLGVESSPSTPLGILLTEIFEQTVEDKLIQPTFITAYPTEVSPLSRVNDDDPAITDRFELFIAGKEIANGFSELNDPEDQAARFKAQVSARDAGDDEAMYYDEDYVTALEYGMPPTAGEGIGIDRLAMLLTDSSSIRDVLLFPLMRKS